MSSYDGLGTILLVEDHAPLRRNLAFLLEVAGFDVMSAADGQEALAALASHTPDLIMADTEMPNLDGYGLLQQVRNSLHWHQLPFIVMSSSYEYDDLMHALSLGASDYLPKPFDIYDVLDTIQRCAPQLISIRRERKAS
jgi:CheY-like chemotaxis protein